MYIFNKLEHHWSHHHHRHLNRQLSEYLLTRDPWVMDCFAHVCLVAVVSCMLWMCGFVRKWRGRGGQMKWLSWHFCDLDYWVMNVTYMQAHRYVNKYNYAYTEKCVWHTDVWMNTVMHKRENALKCSGSYPHTKLVAVAARGLKNTSHTPAVSIWR